MVDSRSLFYPVPRFNPSPTVSNFIDLAGIISVKISTAEFGFNVLVALGFEAFKPPSVKRHIMILAYPIAPDQICPFNRFVAYRAEHPVTAAEPYLAWSQLKRTP